jgi:glycosyltransferase involved in cell wall biosynthesis
MPTLSIVLCTFNRARLLARALTALVAASTDDAELIVVDNNSSDDTAAVVRRFSDGPFAIRLVHEPKQGLSFARNTGICMAKGELIAFTDDDVVVDREWIASVQHAFARFPDAAWIGGKVLPIWPAPPPQWLTAARWAPLALVDYGDRAFVIGPDRPLCIVGANLAVRRAALDVTGLFAASVQRVGAGAGTTEDHELQLRLMNAGFTGAYDPAVVVRAPVDSGRMRKAFHRRWHFCHGRSFAAMRAHDFEASRRRVAGIPGHVVRSLATETLSAAVALVWGRSGEAFEHELRARFAAGFTAERVAPFRFLYSVRRQAELAGPARAGHYEEIESANRIRVSVVIPCYNQARFLGRAIESALAQTLPGVEVVVVDDGSTDDTATIAGRFDGVTCHRQNNRGVAAARNTGLARARGDFVIFLDADDELLPDAAEIGVAALLEAPAAAFAAGIAIPVGSDGTELPFTRPVLHADDARRYDELLTANFMWTPGCAMFRRGIVSSAGGFDESLSGSADYALYLSLARHWPVHWHGRPVVRYRQHSAAMSADAMAMLSETLTVLRREWRGGAIDWRRWRAAAGAWRAWYGDQIADGVRHALGRGRWRSAAVGAAALARMHPAGAAAAVRRALTRRLYAGVAMPALEIAAATERASTSPGSRCEKGTSTAVQTNV